MEPSGASTTRVTIPVTKTIIRGFKKFFAQSGVILSTPISTYLRRIVASIAGMIDEE